MRAEACRRTRKSHDARGHGDDAVRPEPMSVIVIWLAEIEIVSVDEDS